MKKALLIIALCVCAFQSKAQIVTGLDEIALLGDWHATDYWGVWENLEFGWPVSMELNDGKQSYIQTKHNTSTAPTVLDFGGYWVGGTATGRYTLHFICSRGYAGTSSVLSMVNFVVKNFDGQTLTIETYDGSGGATFSKGNSGIESVGADTTEADTTIYNLNGVVVKNPTAPGIYIQGDGKKIVK